MTNDSENGRGFRQRSQSPTSASVTITESPRAPTPARRRGSEAGLIARNSGRMDETSDQITTQDGTGTAVHTRPGTMPLYKPTERNGYIARTVSVSALPMLLAQGWKEFCPICDDHHLDSQGRITTDPNACKAREPVSVRVCPVCRKRIYDNQSLASVVAEETEDPNVIDDNPYGASTPSERTKLKLDLHLWVRHAEWAQANAVPQLPTAFREMVDMGTTSRGT